MTVSRIVLVWQAMLRTRLKKPCGVWRPSDCLKSIPFSWCLEWWEHYSHLLTLIPLIGTTCVTTCCTGRFTSYWEVVHAVGGGSLTLLASCQILLVSVIFTWIFGAWLLCWSHGVHITSRSCITLDGIARYWLIVWPSSTLLAFRIHESTATCVYILNYLKTWRKLLFVICCALL